MKVVALFRVSTEKQENEGASLDAQVRRFRNLASSNRWTIAAEFRGQESAAGAGAERAVLQHVLAYLRGNEVDALWVYEQSRLTRGDQLEVATLFREVTERGLEVYVDGARRDISSIEGEMMFTVQGAFDRAESRRIKERMQRGRREKALQGKRTGGAAPYGYRNPPPGDPRRGTLQIVPDEAATVRRIFRDVAAGVPIRRLCRELTAEGIQAPRTRGWGKTTIRRILDNPAYLGTAFLGLWAKAPGIRSRRLDPLNPDAIMAEGAHEAIVSRELWSAARSAVCGNSNGRPGMLSGLLVVNGQRTQIDSADGQSFYRPAKRGRGAWLPVEVVNELAWEAFRALASDPDRFRRLAVAARRNPAPSPDDELAAIEVQKARLAARLSRLVEMRAEGEIPKAEFAALSDETRRAIRLAEQNAVAVARRAESVSTGASDRLLAVARILAPGLILPASERRLAIASLATAVHVNAIAREAQPRGSGGRFRSPKTPKWKVLDMFFELSPSPALGLSDFGCGQDRARLLVQVVANGRLIAPRRARKAPESFQAGEGAA